MIVEYTAPSVLEKSPDPIDPTEIDWPERQARALIPFDVVHGRPRCPVMYGVPGYVRGRNRLPLWAENPMADALITATRDGVRYVLLVKRGDGGGWAMPGGRIKPGEAPFAAAVRELREETGFVFEHYRWQIAPTVDAPRWVPDERGSMEAWAVTVVARCDLGDVESLPDVRGMDDAEAAAWCEVESLRGSIMKSLIFAPHREILAALTGD